MAKFPKITGMAGGLGGMVQKAMADAQQAEEDLKKTTVEASSPGGYVKVTANGVCEIQSIKISKDIVDPEDVGTLEDLVTIAVREVVEKANKMRQERLSSAIPGGMGGLGGLF